MTKNISRKTATRQCFTLKTTDDGIDEEPERLRITGSSVSRLLEFHPGSAVIWIVDDESENPFTDRLTSLQKHH